MLAKMRIHCSRDSLARTLFLPPTKNGYVNFVMPLSCHGIASSLLTTPALQQSFNEASVPVFRRAA